MMVQEQGRGSFAQIVGGDENLAAERQELTALGLQQMSQYGQNILAFVDDAVPQSDHSSFHSEQSLSGLMIGIKDIIDTKCHPTQYGSPIYEGYQPKADASVVAKAKAHGCMILGKTVTTEFANVSPGKTKNPFRLTHTPGGSSSGSAAAVAAGFLPMALGTQTSGSIIRPASFCGVVGYKPTYGLVSKAGVKALSGTLDTVGGFTRYVRDMRVLAQLLAPQAGFRREQIPLEGLRVGLLSWPVQSEANDDALMRLSDVARLLEMKGAMIKDVDLPHSWSFLFSDQQTIMAVESLDNLSDEFLNHKPQLSDALCQLLVDAQDIAATDYLQARQRALMAEQEGAKLFQQFDVLLCLSTKGEAPEGLANTGDPMFNRMWTLLGYPTLTLPAGVGDTGLPLGIQVAQNKFCDGHLINIAESIEGALNEQCWGHQFYKLDPRL